MFTTIAIFPFFLFGLVVILTILLVISGSIGIFVKKISERLKMHPIQIIFLIFLLICSILAFSQPEEDICIKCKTSKMECPNKCYPW